MFTSFEFEFLDKHIQVSKNVFIRIFSDNVGDQHFQWHRDKKNRYVKVICADSDWQFQFDNQLPFNLSDYQEIFVEKEVYHKLHKGKGKLILVIKEVDNVDTN
jgi:hypothetical protein